ncbi:MAG TPA: hypothetical protein VFY83_13705 [Anaerolineales bacterium]|nr:hypothetical protein [Anaerolineales bacterium]
MKKRLMSIALLVAVMTAFAFGPIVSVQAQAPTPTLTVPVTGTIPDIGGVFTGTFDIQRFTVVNGVLTAVGTLTGTLTDALGNVIGTVTNVPITLPVANIGATCEILDLELGPLDLELLGLMVHLDRINLEITAQQGGGLLGDLLCSVADLLGGPAPLSAVARLLNNILRILG